MYVLCIYGILPQPGSCAFENAHLCSWHTEMNEDLAWQLTNGLQQHGGPQQDHTSNTTTGEEHLSSSSNIRCQYGLG